MNESNKQDVAPVGATRAHRHDSDADPLVQAFEDDHRALTRGLRRLRRCVVDGDWKAAKELAAELDREVGAHIEFEESSFYPVLRRFLGAEFVGQLYGEHEQGRLALAAILAVGPDEAPSLEGQSTILAELDIATSHALSCGTLLSHLETLDEKQRAAMLADLERSRGRARSWTSRQPSRVG